MPLMRSQFEVIQELANEANQVRGKALGIAEEYRKSPSSINTNGIAILQTAMLSLENAAHNLRYLIQEWKAERK